MDWMLASHDSICRRIPSWPDPICSVCITVIAAVRDGLEVSGCEDCHGIIIDGECQCSEEL